MSRHCGKLLLATALLMQGRPGMANEVLREFNVDRQQINTALLEFAQQAHTAILFPGGAFGGIEANPVHGKYEIEEGLKLLLEGTGIEAALINDKNQILVRLDPTADKRVDNNGGEMAMKAEDKRKRNRLAATMAAVVSGATVGMASAQAQEVDAAPASGVEEISVTGSRIQRSGMTTPTPVTVMDRSELEVLACPTTCSDRTTRARRWRGTSTTSCG